MSTNDRNNLWGVLYKRDFLKTFTKFTKKTPVLGSLFNKVADIKDPLIKHIDFRDS